MHPSFTYFQFLSMKQFIHKSFIPDVGFIDIHSITFTRNSLSIVTLFNNSFSTIREESKYYISTLPLIVKR